jgi:hypothetical protein
VRKRDLITALEGIGDDDTEVAFFIRDNEPKGEGEEDGEPRFDIDQLEEMEDEDGVTTIALVADLTEDGEDSDDDEDDGDDEGGEEEGEETDDED